MKTQQDLWEIVPELAEVEKNMEEILFSHADLLPPMDSFLLEKKGKRLRPALFLASARVHRSNLQNLIPLAVSLELIHTATLIHDDVVDNAPMRRNMPTINSSQGDKTAILLGDYFLARAFTILTAFGRLQIVDLMANVIEEMSMGELQQQKDAFNTNLTENDYLEKIKQKTALFIASCCLAGYLTSGTTAEIESAFYNYGLNLGMAFQIIDDVLDFYGKDKNTGKEKFSDIKNGIITLPVIHTLQLSPRKEELYRCLNREKLNEAEILLILNEIKSQQGLQYSIKTAKNYIARALSCLKKIPSEEAVENLKAMARFVLARAY
ncbi:MAG: polyprenyl synthetase family protein [Dethiobacter sp.]|nr:MAG: polyprenyl synthetase family protein [Dethiobacter sp.]